MFDFRYCCGRIYSTKHIDGMYQYTTATTETKVLEKNAHCKKSAINTLIYKPTLIIGFK